MVVNICILVEDASLIVVEAGGKISFCLRQPSFGK